MTLMTLRLCKYFHCGTRNLIDITEREMEFPGSKPALCEARSRGMARLVESPLPTERNMLDLQAKHAASQKRYVEFKY